MATAKDGVNPARQGAAPARQDPRPARQGRADGLDPTNQSGQTPSEIFGLGTHLDSTGLGGSGSEGEPSDVTLNKGQLDEVFSHTGPEVNTHTGVAGSDGAHNGNGGPDSVTYTDPWAVVGGVTREHTVGAHIDGPGDWTQANDQGYSGGPNLPVLENNRPTSTGLGSGHVSSHNHPNAGK